MRSTKCVPGWTSIGRADRSPLQELNERYPEGSETCSRQPQWNYEVLTGGKLNASR